MITFNELVTGITENLTTTSRIIITEAVIDSRKAIPGSLFVALPGERTNGHRFIQAAFEKGAHIALIQEDVADCMQTIDLRNLKPGDSDWYPIQLATNAFGQGVAVTPIQMVTAISSIANDGKMMKPHVLKAVIYNGQQYNTSPQVLSVPIKAETARTMTNMLVKSLENESSLALVPGYQIAGKTGTAEIPVEGIYGSEQTHASFVGWGPADDPQFIVYVWLAKPQKSPWGSVVAAPVFRDVVEKLVVLMRIPPDNIRLGTAN